MCRIIALLCLWACGLVLAGCMNVNADGSGLGGGGGSATPPPDAASDPRSVQDLRRENAQLRARLVDLEKQYAAYETAIDRQKKEIDDLERQRDELKKERDRAKKAAKN